MSQYLQVSCSSPWIKRGIGNKQDRECQIDGKTKKERERERERDSEMGISQTIEIQRGRERENIIER